MLNKSEKLIIIGKSGSGKDYLLRKLTEKELKPSLKVTTRPKRENEQDGVTYRFQTNNEFDSLLENKKFIVSQEFKNDKGHLWKYGTLMEDFKSSQLFIMTPGEVAQITPELRKECFIVYLDIDRKVRENRLFKREDANDSISRRIEADENDFKEFNDYDLKITDPEFDSDTILSLMY